MAARGGKWLRRLLIAACALFVLVLIARLYPPFRHPVDALLLAQSLFAGGEGGWLKKWTLPPERSPAPLEKMKLDLYRQTAGAGDVRGCVLLAHGMTDAGRRDPRLMDFAENVSRLGFAVAVPELPGMRRFRPDRRDTDRIAESFTWLHNRFGRSGRRCGMFAFSFAAGPAMKAAVLRRVAPRVGYFIGVGAYLDLTAVLRYLTTGGRGDAPAFPGGPPVRVGKWLFLRYNMALLGLMGYEDEVETIVRRKIADEDADISALAARLPVRIQRLLSLIGNRDPGRFDELLRDQPGELLVRLNDWSVRADISRSAMPIFLLHGRSDPFVPFSESLRLAELARRRRDGAGRVRLLIAESLAHVDPERGKTSPGFRGLIEALRLVGFVSDVLTAMEGG